MLSCKTGDRLASNLALSNLRARGAATLTISMHNSSVGVFTQFLSSLSDLLDHAADHAEARNIDPSILLNARLYPNMPSPSRGR